MDHQYNGDALDDEKIDVENPEELERHWSETSEKNMYMTEPLLVRRRTNTTSQIAVIGSNTCPIESLNYEIIENELFKQEWRSRKKIQIFQYVFLKWALALLIALSTALVGFFHYIGVENIAGQTSSDC